MSYYATHYRTGETIQAGDRVLWSGREGRVMFVLGELPEDDWYRVAHGEGFMLDVQGVGWVLERESDEDLKLVGRGAAVST